MDISILAAELIAGHPITGAYDADPVIAEGQINAVNIVRIKDTVEGSEVLNATVDTEFDLLTDAEKNMWVSLCSIDSIDTTSGVAKSLEKQLFGVATVTRTNLIELKNENISQATYLGLGNVRAGDIQRARS